MEPSNRKRTGSKIDAARLWSLNYRLVMSVIIEVAPDIAALGLEVKELFVLSAVEESPHPAELAAALCMPRPTVTVNVKRLEAAGFLQREIDPTDLRRYRLLLTPPGRKVLAQGLAHLTAAFGQRLGRLTAPQQQALNALLERMSVPLSPP